MGLLVAVEENHFVRCGWADGAAGVGVGDRFADASDVVELERQSEDGDGAWSEVFGRRRPGGEVPGEAAPSAADWGSSVAPCGLPVADAGRRSDERVL